MAGDLWQSIGRGDLDLVRKLIAEDPALVNAPSKWGLTPLIMAVKAGQVEVAQLLIEHGANVNLPCDLISPATGEVDASVTPLMFCRSVEMAEMLIENGAFPDAQDAVGRSCFWRIGETARPEILQVLVSSGVHPTAQDLLGLHERATEELNYRSNAKSGDHIDRTESLKTMITWLEHRLGGAG